VSAKHRLRGVLIRILDDTRDVEEVSQDAFVQAWRSLDSYRGDSSLFTWFYRIGVNAALARARRKRLTTVDVSAFEDVAREKSIGNLPESAALSRDLRRRIVAALGELPYEYREAVVLRDVAGLSNVEVADAIGIGLAAAKSRVHRGRLQLRELLGPEQPD
jgi:RNA polymerase sigma-70 factor (ECF subfamily)